MLEQQEALNGGLPLRRRGMRAERRKLCMISSRSPYGVASLNQPEVALPEGAFKNPKVKSARQPTGRVVRQSIMFCAARLDQRSAAVLLGQSFLRFLKMLSFPLLAGLS